MNRIVQTEKLLSQLTEALIKKAYRIVFTNNYKALIIKADSSSLDCRISKKIPQFACFSCHIMLQSEKSDLNMKTRPIFLILLVIKEISHFVCFHRSLILQSEEFEQKESSSSD